MLLPMSRFTYDRKLSFGQIRFLYSWRFMWVRRSYTYPN